MALQVGAPKPDLRLRLHIRILKEPLYFTVDQMLGSMRDVYAQAGIAVEIGSTTRLALPELEDLDIGPCVRGVLTMQQARLFSHRRGIGSGEVVVYFIRSTLPRSRGCAAHPENRPGAVVTRVASLWTLAHEVGHVLGLGHTDDPARLMMQGDTSRITVEQPRISAEEIAILRASPLLHRG
jgi:hypothetical protein